MQCIADRTLPAILPYLLSFAASYQMVTHGRLRTWIFIAILASIAALSWLLRLGAIGTDAERAPILYLIIIQTFVYFVAAGVIWPRRRSEPHGRAP
jgi:hypothetical protein